MRKLLGCLVALIAVSAGGLLAAPSGSAAPTAKAAATNTAAGTTFTPAPLVFGTCADPGLTARGIVCGYLTVPLDWANPFGAKIKIAVSKVEHTVPASKYQGVMITNPGGPGGSGLSLATLGGDVPHGAGDVYDWIGFDPRGVGSSIPRLSCIPDYFAGPRPNYTPTEWPQQGAWIKRTKAYDAACAANGGALLDHMKTTDVAKDMDAMRAALRVSQINYYGFSYGTYLGSVYSTLYPTRVRRMVLDSTVDPRGVWYQDNLDQDVAFQKTMDAWFGWLAKYDGVYHLGTTTQTVKKLWYNEKFHLATHPAGGVVGADEWTDIFLYAGYYQIVWTDLADVFASWVHDRDLATLTAAYEDYVGPTDDNGFAVYAAVQCTDASWPGFAKQKADNWATYVNGPFETWDNFWYNAPCLYWPAKAGTPVTIDGSKVKSVLMIDETLDAATPYKGSLYVRSLYPNASLIAEPGGTTHAGTLYGNACVDDQIAKYIVTGTLPARRAGNSADTYCAPLPQPVPDGASSAAKTTAAGASRLSAARLKIASGTLRP